MNSFQQVIWLLYVVAALGMVFMIWYGLRRVRQLYIQDALILLAIAIFLTPCTATPGGNEFAPALVVLIFEGLLEPDMNGWRGGLPIIFTYLLLLLLLAAKYIIGQRLKSSLPINGIKNKNQVKQPLKQYSVEEDKDESTPAHHA